MKLSASILMAAVAVLFSNIPASADPYRSVELSLAGYRESAQGVEYRLKSVSPVVIPKWVLSGRGLTPLPEPFPPCWPRCPSPWPCPDPMPKFPPVLKEMMREPTKLPPVGPIPWPRPCADPMVPAIMDDDYSPVPSKIRIPSIGPWIDYAFMAEVTVGSDGKRISYSGQGLLDMIKPPKPKPKPNKLFQRQWNVDMMPSLD